MENTDVKTMTDEEEFNTLYITSTEIGEQLGVKRSTILNARRRGLLPNAVPIRGVRTFIWKRKELQPYLESWTISLASRRGELRHIE